MFWFFVKILKVLPALDNDIILFPFRNGRISGLSEENCTAAKRNTAIIGWIRKANTIMGNC